MSLHKAIVLALAWTLVASFGAKAQSTLPSPQFQAVTVQKQTALGAWPTGSEPASPSPGWLGYDTTRKTPVYWDGSAWQTTANQQGVLLDTFRRSDDPDDTASMTRAVAAGVPILLGPRTYSIHDFSTGACAQFVLSGVKGQSIIQRNATTNPTGTFFGVTCAAVTINGVVFDSNSGAITANQWGVLISGGGQTVSVTNSRFENNSGSIGSGFTLASTGPAAGGTFVFDHNEVDHNTFNAAWFGSVSKGSVTNNWVHDNATVGILVASFNGATSTNFSKDVLVEGNHVARNPKGIFVGGIGSPYVYGTPSAVDVIVTNNQIEDSSLDYLTLQGDYLTATQNIMTQSAPSVAVASGVDCNSRYSLVAQNYVNLAGSAFGIDGGASVDTRVLDNSVTVNSGTALNIGGSINQVVKRNKIWVTGTASAFTVFETETDGSGFPFPQANSNLVVTDNQITMDTGTVGFNLFDDAGGRSGALPTVFTNNAFIGLNSASSANAIVYVASGGAVVLQGNTWNGTSKQFLNPNGSNNLIFIDVFDQVATFAGASATITAIESNFINTFGGGGSALYTFPMVGGANYTAATTLSVTAGGCSSWAGTPLISQGVIVGVRTTNKGTGCSGTVTVAATDSGGGSGATFSTTTTPTLLSHNISVISSGVTSIIASGGGFTGLFPAFPLILQSGTGEIVYLQSVNTNRWNASQTVLPNFAISALPPSNATSCPSAYNGAQALVTGSTSGKWQARCNGTNWVAPDGTTIN